MPIPIVGERVGLNYLTPREFQVLRCAAQGMTLEETGRALFIAPKTVKTYRTLLLRRLGAKNMSHAIAMWLCDGEELPG